MRKKAVATHGDNGLLYCNIFYKNYLWVSRATDSM